MDSREWNEFKAKLFEREMDAQAERLHPQWRRMSPEECCAREGHQVLVYGFDRYRYRDPALGAWVRRFAEVLSPSQTSDAERERYRQQYLTPEEYSRVCREIKEQGAEFRSFEG